MFQVELSHAGHCMVTPRQMFPVKVHALHLLLTSRVGSCTLRMLSLPVRGCEMKGEEISEGILRRVMCTEGLGFLMHLVAHAILQETEYFLVPTRLFDYSTQRLLLPYPCFRVIGLQLVPWGWRKILHIFFLIAAPSL